MSRPADPHTKIELLRAAESVFASKGLAASKIEDITTLAGVSKGAFYLHFEGKDDCFRQIVEAFLAHMATRIEPPAALRGRSEVGPAEALELCVAHDRDILEFCWQSRSTFKLLFDGAGGASYAYLLDEFSERVAVNAAAWIEQSRASGLYREDIDAKVLALLLSGAYERLARAIVRQETRPDLEAWAQQAQALFAWGMMTEKARGELDRPVTHRATAPVNGAATKHPKGHAAARDAKSNGAGNRTAARTKRARTA